MFATLSDRLGTLLADPFETARREFARDVNALRSGRVRNARPNVPLSLQEDESRVSIELDVPGFRHDDIELAVEDGRLFIRGERRAPERSDGPSYDERTYGRFERVVRLAETIDVDSIDATLQDGVLRITLARKPEAVPRRIVVKHHGPGAQEVAPAAEG